MPRTEIVLYTEKHFTFNQYVCVFSSRQVSVNLTSACNIVLRGPPDTEWKIHTDQEVKFMVRKNELMGYNTHAHTHTHRHTNTETHTQIQR